MRPTRVLIAEDQESARRALVSILRDEGYEVAEAADGEDAAALLDGFDPDVVLSDLQMPRLDGLGLLQAAMAQVHKPAFLLMSSRISAVVEARARALGCAAVLAKPIDLEDALSMLKSAAAERLGGSSPEISARD